MSVELNIRHRKLDNNDGPNIYIIIDIGNEINLKQTFSDTEKRVLNKREIMRSNNPNHLQLFYCPSQQHSMVLRIDEIYFTKQNNNEKTNLFEANKWKTAVNKTKKKHFKNFAWFAPVKNVITNNDDNNWRRKWECLLLLKFYLILLAHIRDVFNKPQRSNWDMVTESRI